MMTRFHPFVSTVTRRQMLAALAAAPFASRLGRARAQQTPPMRALTSGPNFHWFGYYDKWEFDPSDRYVLGNEATFEGRQPTSDDVIKLGMVDLQDGDAWIELGETNAWCWQQGCMLQWLPGSDTEVIYNDRQDGGYVARILDTMSGQSRTLAGPIYAISPDGKTAVAPDFRRLADLRPGYGYAGIADPYANQGAPTQTGIQQIDLVTGQQKLLLSYADVVSIPHTSAFPNDANHWVNHLLYSPTGERFVFLHRWSGSGISGWKTRMITVKADGTDPYVLNPHEFTSHFIWRDPEHILAWSRHPDSGDEFHLWHDKTTEVEVIGADTFNRDGHCTYLPRHNNEWILNDTYPDGDRLQHVHLYHVPTGEVVTLGKLHSPNQYTGAWRVDTHPRFSRDGTKVVVDSPHDGGRQLYLFDVSDIVGPPEPLPELPDAGAPGDAGAGGTMANSGGGGGGGGDDGSQAAAGASAAGAGQGGALAGSSSQNGSPTSSSDSGCGCSMVGRGRSQWLAVGAAGAAAAGLAARNRQRS